MSAAWLYGTRDLRRRWATFVALGLVAAVAGGLVLAAWSGARRTHTAIARFTSTTRMADAAGPIAAADEANWEQVAALPEVAAAGRIAGRAVMSHYDFDAGGFTFWGIDDTGRVGTVVNRFIVVRGRRVNPDAPDEVTLYESEAKKWGLDVGDTLELMSWQDGSWQEAVTTDSFTPNGPTLEMKVVGIVRSPYNLGDNSTVAVNQLTPAFGRAYPQIDLIGQLGFYRLRGGVASATAFAADALAITNKTPKANPDDFETTFEISDVKGQIGDAIDVAENGQRAFAVIGAVATFLTIAIATNRAVRHGEREALSALGMSTRARILAGIIPLSIAATLAFVGSAAVGYAGSRWFMPSLARRVDPVPGPRFDPLVTVAAFAAGLTILALGAVAIARRVRSTKAQPSVGRVPAAGAASLLGVSLARIGRAGRAGASRGAIAGVVVALVGLAGGAIYIRSLDKLNHDPARWGLDADFTATVPDDFAARATSSSIVAAAATLHYGFSFINGSPVHTVAFEPIVGRMQADLLQGRLPLGDDEIAMSTGFFDKNVHIGSTVSVLDKDGNPIEMTVVGQAVATQLDGRGTLAKGVVVTPAAFDRLRVDQLSTTTAVRMLPGQTREQATEAIGATTHNVFPVEHPIAVSNLTAMRSVIIDLIGFLCILGLAGALLSFIAAIRRGRPNIAIAGALGMGRSTVRRALVVFIGGVVMAGAVVAFVGGYVGGLSLWRIQSESLGVRQVTVVPWVILGVVFLAGVLGALVLGAMVGDRFGRVRSYEALRAE